MNDNLIKAHLNLHAVLQNLEELVKLDPEMAQLCKDWDIAIQFSVRNGPAAHVTFKDGLCTHGIGQHPCPTVKLLFLSPKHLNDMFDGKGTPIPLKGFTRLRFLSKDFAQLTDRLTYYLKPGGERPADEDYAKISTILMLYTGFHAIRELAELEPTSKKIAAHVPNGELQVEVLPDGPCISVVFDNGALTVRKAAAEKPMAKMTFKDLDAASCLLTGQLDVFLAVAEGDITLEGRIPAFDGAGLMLDRVEGYLT